LFNSDTQLPQACQAASFMTQHEASQQQGEPSPRPSAVTVTPGARLWDEQRSCCVPIDQLREGEHGQLVLRLTRKRSNHAAWDAREDAVYEQLFAAFTGWLERADGQFTQVVRLTQPRGAELLDVGKWAVEYAPVVGGSAPRDEIGTHDASADATATSAR
jgi:hypothetical protein